MHRFCVQGQIMAHRFSHAQEASTLTPQNIRSITIFIPSRNYFIDYARQNMKVDKKCTCPSHMQGLKRLKPFPMTGDRQIRTISWKAASRAPVTSFSGATSSIGIQSEATRTGAASEGSGGSRWSSTSTGRSWGTAESGSFRGRMVQHVHQPLLGERGIE